MKNIVLWLKEERALRLTMVCYKQRACIGIGGQDGIDN